MYRHNFSSTSRSQHTQDGRKRFHLWLLAFVGIGIVVFVSARHSQNKTSNTDNSLNTEHTHSGKKTLTNKSKTEYVYRKRLNVKEIPPFDLKGQTYGQIFNDSNYVQLTAARQKGIDPHSLGDPAKNDKLVLLQSTEWYHVDTMYHARPYLIPEASLLLQYIGERFQQLMDENYPEKGKYRIIVTSALRTEESEQKLKRVNRNATDTSCHIYGTTFDLSAQRYRFENQCDTVVDYCKQMLAQVLYELRYEGLCYVKYERRSCFHITIRSTQYQGDANWEMKRYISPGSPSIVIPKVAVEKQNKSIQSKPVTTQKNTSTKENVSVQNTPAKPAKHNNKTVERSKPKQQQTIDKKDRSTERPTRTQQPITERERLSLEHFERNY